MIKIVKLIIWLVGFGVVSIFVLNYFGYEINQEYFTKSRSACEENLSTCGKEYVKQGTKNAQCDFDCLNPKLIIKKRQ